MLSVKKMLLKLLTPKNTIYTTSNLNHLASCSASIYAIGKIGILYIAAKNTSSQLAIGSDATCTINIPELMGVSKGCGYSGNTAMLASITTSGTLTMRATGAAWQATYDCAIAIPVIIK